MTTATLTATDPGLAEKNIDLALELLEASLCDPDAFADIPMGASLVLVPPDDPELFAHNIEVAVAALRRGEDVYLRLVRPSEHDRPR